MNHEQTVQWWRDKAETYFTDKVFSFSQPQLIERLKIQPTNRVLEIGFGYGRELSQFCRKSSWVHGVELDEFTIQLAYKELQNLGYCTVPFLKTYDGRIIPFQDRFFNVVYSCFVLQHMSRVAARELIREALRVTKPGGKVLMELFGDPAYQHDTEDRFSGDPNAGGMYNNGYNLANVNALLLGLGEILWIEPQRVSAEGRTFDNWWFCITPNERSD